MYTCISTYLFFKIFFFDQRSYEKNKIANTFSLSFEAFQFLNKFEVIKTKQLGVFCCCNIKVLRIRKCGAYYNVEQNVVFNTECSFTRLTTSEACADILYLHNSLLYAIIASKDILY